MAVMAVVWVCMLMHGCSLKKNTAVTRHYMAFITRYNVYYNGDEHYKYTLREQETTYKDDLSRTLYLSPIEAKADPKAPQPSGSFQRSIDKAAKAIQIRSIKRKPKKQPGKSYDEAYKEWMRRTEYNPFLHNAWMLMGRSQYHNGDFTGAAATFYYISKNFKWLPDVVTEAKLWQARAYLADDWTYEAEMIVSRIKPEQLTTKTLRRLYAFDYADLYIRTDQYAEAVPHLQTLISLSDSHQRMRLNYLLGQILTRLGRKGEAYKAFGRAGRSAQSDYAMQFNARIRQSEVYQGDNIEPEVKALRRMVRYDRNAEYLDQIYYAIGNLYLSRRDTTEAMANYRLAVSKSTREGYDKALANLALGNLYFDQHRYDLAQPCIAEAVPQLPEDFPGLDSIRLRSDVLDELSTYAQNVHLQDSLLALAALSAEEQRAVCERMAREYVERKKAEEEQMRREAQRAEQEANQLLVTPDDNVANIQRINTDDSWYFYNPTSVAQGKKQFQRLWGARRNEDNWRRRNKSDFSMSDFGTEDGSGDGEEQDGETDSESEEPTDDDGKQLPVTDDPATAEYYMKDIPKTDLEKAQAADIVQEGLYNMGLILKDKLGDTQAALAEFDDLMKRFPDNVYRLDVYYNIYLMMVHDGDMAGAERYRQLILTEFPESQLGQAMRNPDYLENLKVMDSRQEQLYEQTWQAYLDNRNAEVQEAYRTMQRDYPLSKIMPKFMFLDALTYVTENKPEEFAARLRELLEKYPDTDLTPMASAYLKGITSGRKLHQSATNVRGMLWNTRLISTGDTTTVDLDAPLKVTLDPSSPQLFVMLYPLARVNQAALLYEVARYNFSTFSVRDFDLEQMTFGQLGVTIVKGFANALDLERYRTSMERSKFRLPQYVRPVVISVANFDKLLKEGRSFEEYFQAVGEQAIDFTHEAVLPADADYPPAAEMYDAYAPGERPGETPSEPSAPHTLPSVEVDQSEATALPESETATESEGDTLQDRQPEAESAPETRPETEQERFERIFDAIPLTPPAAPKPSEPQEAIDNEPQPVPQSAPQSQQQPEPQSYTESEPQSKPDPTSEFTPQAAPVAPQPQSVTEPDPTPQAAPQSQPETKPESTPQAAPQSLPTIFDVDENDYSEPVAPGFLPTRPGVKAPIAIPDVPEGSEGDDSDEDYD